MVRVRLPGEQNWSLATCTKQISPRSYEVLCGDRKYRRNRRDLRKTTESQMDSSKEEQVPASTDSSVVPAFGGVPHSKENEDNEQQSLRRSTRVRKLPERFQA